MNNVWNVTCPLNVSQFGHLGNFEASDNIFRERHANVSGRHQKYFLPPWLGGHFAHLSLVCLAIPGDTLNIMWRLSPSLAIAQGKRVMFLYSHCNKLCWNSNLDLCSMLEDLFTFLVNAHCRTIVNLYLESPFFLIAVLVILLSQQFIWIAIAENVANPLPDVWMA